VRAQSPNLGIKVKLIRTAIAMNIENTDFILFMVFPLLSAGP
jgi:hypothetical protein